MIRALCLALLALAPARGERLLTGRVLAPDGQPVAGATIALVAPASEPGKPRVRLLEATGAADGRFELRCAEEARGELFLRGEGAGVRVVKLEPGTGARALGDLKLVGPAWLSGRASFVDGHPAPDLELWAVPEDVAAQPNALILCTEQAFERELSGAGLFSTRVRTDIDGRFKLGGLRPGRYMLRCPRPAVVLEPRSGYYQATTENISLAVESARLRVRALDGAGRELVGARVRLLELNEVAAGRYQPGQAWNETVGGPLACASFDVEPEAAYSLRIQAPGFGVQEDLVLLAQKEYEQVREYRLAPLQPPGRVRLVLQPLAQLTPGPFVVELVSPLTLAPDPEAEPLKPDEQGWLPPLAPGAYLFALRFQDPPGGTNWYLPAETREVLQLESKAEREVAVKLAAGGRFELSLTGAKLAQVEVRVEGLEGQPASALHFSAAAGGPAGAPARGLELLAPGRYTIHASAPDSREIEAEVLLEAGKTTRLELALKPR